MQTATKLKGACAHRRNSSTIRYVPETSYYKHRKPLQGMQRFHVFVLSRIFGVDHKSTTIACTSFDFLLSVAISPERIEHASLTVMYGY